jgi:hypothetical protein
VGGDQAAALRGRGVGAGAGAPHRARAHHDAPGAALCGRPALWAQAGPLDPGPFKVEIRRLLREEPRLPGVPVPELIADQGHRGGKPLVYDYLAEVRPLYPPQRCFAARARSPRSTSPARRAG